MQTKLFNELVKGRLYRRKKYMHKINGREKKIRKLSRWVEKSERNEFMRVVLSLPCAISINWWILHFAKCAYTEFVSALTALIRTITLNQEMGREKKAARTWREKHNKIWICRKLRLCSQYQSCNGKDHADDPTSVVYIVCKSADSLVWFNYRSIARQMFIQICSSCLRADRRTKWTNRRTNKPS